MREFDRIKAMSIDELAEYITSIMADAYYQCTKTMVNYLKEHNVSADVIEKALKERETE